MVKGALGDSGSLTDHRDAGPVIALLGKAFLSRSEDAGAGFISVAVGGGHRRPPHLAYNIPTGRYLHCSLPATFRQCGPRCGPSSHITLSPVVQCRRKDLRRRHVQDHPDQRYPSWWRPRGVSHAGVLHASSARAARYAGDVDGRDGGRRPAPARGGCGRALRALPRRASSGAVGDGAPTHPPGSRQP